MKYAARKEEGIIAIAGVFGLIGGAVTYVMLGFGFAGAGLIALGLAVVVAVVLWLGWRDAKPSPMTGGPAPLTERRGPADPVGGIGSTAPTAPATPVAPVTSGVGSTGSVASNPVTSVSSATMAGAAQTGAASTKTDNAVSHQATASDSGHASDDAPSHVSVCDDDIFAAHPDAVHATQRETSGASAVDRAALRGEGTIADPMVTQSGEDHLPQAGDMVGAGTAGAGLVRPSSGLGGQDAVTGGTGGLADGHAASDTPALLPEEIAQIKQAEDTPDAIGDMTFDATPGEADQPHMLTGPRDGTGDDLKEVKGIGPKLEAMLHGMGVYHFDQIAAWTPAELAWVDANLQGFKGRASRDTWQAQARVLADGGDTAFSRKVEQGEVY